MKRKKKYRSIDDTWIVDEEFIEQEFKPIIHEEYEFKNIDFIVEAKPIFLEIDYEKRKSS